MYKYQLEKFEKFKQFFKDDYSNLEFFLLSELITDRDPNLTDYAAQVRAYLGFVEGYSNKYIGYLRMLKHYFQLNRDIIEIGSGKLPILSHYIDEEQRLLKEGTVTAYDPRIIKTQIGNIIQKKEFFLSSTNVKENSLLVGICPCNGTKELIEKANDEKLEFFLSLCDCPPHYGNIENLKNYIPIDLGNEFKLIEERLDDKHCIKNPILIKKRK